jgi:NAD(P)-dependent dehydrogenase (short-subunit alcohol dehydrogenase family)
MVDFIGKVAVVTGGASGLGLASASLFAKRGAAVVILDIDATRGEKAVQGIRANGGKAAFSWCDVSSEDSVREAIAHVIDTQGAIDILHANAGIIDTAKRIFEMTYADWRRIMDINCNGMFLSAKYVIPRMLAKGAGSIVFTGSNWAYVCDPGFSSYAASKGAVVSFARALALDHARDNIRINVVCPGNMMTPLLERQLSTEPDPRAALSAMGRVSTPEEIANVVVFMASDDASAMKGSAVIIDQGETLGYGKGLGPLNGRTQ